MHTNLSAELSSVEYSLTEMASRIASLAESVLAEKNEAAAMELYQAERAILTAVRRLKVAYSSK